MHCARCGTKLRDALKDTETFPNEALRFCSAQCLIAHIRSNKSVGRDWLNDLGVRASNQSWGDRNCLSTFLGVAFRSWFECDVAEYIVKKWKTPVFYEPHILPLDETHFYMPDFWLPEYGIWLEVKGEWRLGAKSKFQKALLILKPDRLILIPSIYRRWFKRRH